MEHNYIVCACVHACVRVRVRICIHIHVYVHVCMHVCVYVLYVSEEVTKLKSNIAVSLFFHIINLYSKMADFWL